MSLSHPTPAASVRAVGDRSDDMIRGPSWRKRTTPARRHRAALITIVLYLVPGLGLMIGSIVVLGLAGAAGWIQLLPWLVPMVSVLAWSLSDPTPADVTDFEEQTWSGYVIRYVLIGEEVPRDRPHRIIAAVVLGGPVGWVIVIATALAVVGIG